MAGPFLPYDPNAQAVPVAPDPGSALLGLLQGLGATSGQSLPFRTIADRYAYEDIRDKLGQYPTAEELRAVEKAQREFAVSREAAYAAEDEKNARADRIQRLLSSVMHGGLTMLGTPGTFGESVAAGANQAFATHNKLSDDALAAAKAKTLADEYKSQQANRLFQQTKGAVAASQKQAALENTQEYRDRVVELRKQNLSETEAHHRATEEIMSGRLGVARDQLGVARDRLGLEERRTVVGEERLAAGLITREQIWAEAEELEKTDPGLAARYKAIAGGMSPQGAIHRRDLTSQTRSGLPTDISARSALGLMAGMPVDQATFAKYPEYAAAMNNIRETIKQAEESGQFVNRAETERRVRDARSILAKAEQQARKPTSSGAVKTYGVEDVRQRLRGMGLNEKEMRNPVVRQAYDTLTNHFNNMADDGKVDKAITDKMFTDLENARRREKETYIPEGQGVPNPAPTVVPRGTKFTPPPPAEPLPADMYATKQPPAGAAPAPTSSPVPPAPAGAPPAGAPAPAEGAAPPLVSREKAAQFIQAPAADRKYMIEQARKRGDDKLAAALEVLDTLADQTTAPAPGQGNAP